MQAPPSPSPPKPNLPQQSLAQRYKLAWRLLLISNLALGAYMFARARKKDAGPNGKTAEEISSASVAALATLPPEEPLLPPENIEPRRVLEPIPEDVQRDIFRWILEEKRKVKPINPEEKERVDEEKAILKQFVRAQSIPKF